MFTKGIFGLGIEPMTMALLAGAGGAAGGGLGWLAGQKEEKNPYGALNPEQISLTKALGPRLTALATSGPDMYMGELTTPLTAEEAANIKRFEGLSNEGYDTLSNVMYDPVEFNNQFREEVASPAYQNFSQFEQPILEEAVPYSGSARARTVGDALTTLRRDLLGTQFTAREAAKDRGVTAARSIPEYGMGTASVLSIPRQVKQAGLDRTYQEYVRASDQNRRDIDAALNFLGISTGTYRPDTRATMAMAGAFGGAKLGLGVADYLEE